MGEVDTSGVITASGMSTGDLPCGTVYENLIDNRHVTRWYRDGLLVERIAQSRVRGTLTLSPTGSGISASLAADLSWDERFLSPGDLASASLPSVNRK